MQGLIERAKELLADGTVAQVLGWRKGDMGYDPEPAYFHKEEELENFVYDAFCGANLSKYMIEAAKLAGAHEFILGLEKGSRFLKALRYIQL